MDRVMWEESTTSYGFKSSSPLLNNQRSCKVDSTRKHKRKAKPKGDRKREHSMVSREQKRTALHEKLQLLRSTTNSHASTKTSIIIDASKYIEKLKKKVERQNQDMATAQTSSDQNPLPMVTVETLGKGFLVNVISANSCPGLLVSILEAFEEINLNVLDARVSCADTFRFQAIGENEEQSEGVDVQAVEKAVGQAIKNWSESTDQQ